MNAILQINSAIQWIKTIQQAADALPQTQRRKLLGINSADNVIRRLEMVKAELEGRICDHAGCNRIALPDDLFCPEHRAKEDAILPDWASAIIDGPAIQSRRD